jgi:hypothetical protein
MPTIEQVLALADAIEKFKFNAPYKSLRKEFAVNLAEAFRGSGIVVNEGMTHAFERYWQWSMLVVETDEERGYLEQLKEIAADRFACLLLAYLGRNEPAEVPDRRTEDFGAHDGGDEDGSPKGAYESESPPPPSSAPATPSDGELPL